MIWSRSVDKPFKPRNVALVVGPALRLMQLQVVERRGVGERPIAKRFIGRDLLTHRRSV
jgi:hypothetical protein